MSKLSNSEVIVRAATKDDMKAVAGMIRELADFEKMSDGPKLSIEDLQRDLTSQPPAFHCKVAELSTDGAVVGYAIYFPTYSTWKGRALMLEDLYVRPAFRRRGIGEKLFNAVAQEASTTGCSRLDFHVLEWNDARAFYERKGAENLTQKEQWCYYRLSGDKLYNCGKSA